MKAAEDPISSSVVGVFAEPRSGEFVGRYFSPNMRPPFKEWTFLLGHTRSEHSFPDVSKIFRPLKILLCNFRHLNFSGKNFRPLKTVLGPLNFIQQILRFKSSKTPLYNFLKSIQKQNINEMSPDELDSACGLKGM